LNKLTLTKVGDRRLNMICLHQATKCDRIECNDDEKTNNQAEYSNRTYELIIETYSLN
jgi:hypothetical protein